MKAYIPEYLKRKNRKLIFDLFVSNPQLSRADIVRLTGMSFPTASKAVDYLVSRNILFEDDCPSIPGNGGLGRKSRMLTLNTFAYYAIALEFEGHFVDIGLVDLAGNVVENETLPFSNFTDTRQMQQLGKRVAHFKTLANSPVLGVGIGLPASINPDDMLILGFPATGLKRSVSFRSFFSDFLQELDMDVFIDNDVNLACKGEVFRRGLSFDKSSLAYFTLGSGFGAGIMLNGYLWPGKHFHAGEIGNTLISTPDLSKPLAGQTTILESCINIGAINRKFGLQLNQNSDLSPALREDIVEFILPPLVTAIYNFVLLFDLEDFVLSGFIPKLLGTPLYERLNTHVNELIRNEDRLITIRQPYGQHSALLGAASMVFDNTILDELLG